MQLAEMGFPLEACRKAVYYTGNMGPEMAFNWIIAHMEEPGDATNQCMATLAMSTLVLLSLKYHIQASSEGCVGVGVGVCVCVCVCVEKLHPRKCLYDTFILSC